MAAGDGLIDADGYELMNSEGYPMLSNGVDDSCCCGGTAGDDCDCPTDCLCNGAGTVYRAESFASGAFTGNPADQNFVNVGTLTAGTYCIKYENGSFTTDSGATWNVGAEIDFFEAGTHTYANQFFAITNSGTQTTEADAENVGDVLHDPNSPCFTFPVDVDIWIGHGIADHTAFGTNGAPGIRICQITETRVNQYPNWVSMLSGGVWSDPVFTGWTTTPATTPLNQWNYSDTTARWSGSPTLTCEDLVDEPGTPPVTPEGP